MSDLGDLNNRRNRRDWSDMSSGSTPAAEVSPCFNASVHSTLVDDNSISYLAN